MRNIHPQFNAQNCCEIVSHYQIFVDSRTFKPSGAEVLVRWNHPVYGILGAQNLMSCIEDKGIQFRILKYLIKYIIQNDIQKINIDTLSINLEAGQLAQKRTIYLISNVVVPLREFGIKLEIEITERESMKHNIILKRNISELNDLGVTLAVDDFGEGHSNFSRLIDFDFSKIKLSKNIILSVFQSDKSMKIVESIACLAAKLGIVLTAEGVETLDQALTMRDMGCHYLQGYLFSRPVSGKEMSSMLETRALSLDNRRNYPIKSYPKIRL